MGQRSLPYKCWKGSGGYLPKYEEWLEGLWWVEQGFQQNTLLNTNTPKYVTVTQPPSLDGLALVSQVCNMGTVWVMEQCLLSHWFLWAENDSGVIKERDGLFSTTLVVFSGFHLGLRMTVAQYTSEIWKIWQNIAKPERLVITVEVLFFVEKHKYSYFSTTTDMLYSSAVPGTSRTSRPPRTSGPKRRGRRWTKGTCTIVLHTSD